MMPTHNPATGVTVCRKAEPGLPKLAVDAIQLIENSGIDLDLTALEILNFIHEGRRNG